MVANHQGKNWPKKVVVCVLSAIDLYIAIVTLNQFRLKMSSKSALSLSCILYTQEAEPLPERLNAPQMHRCKIKS